MNGPGEMPLWQVALGGVLFAAATFGLLWALPILFWALEGAG